MVGVGLGTGDIGDNKGSSIGYRGLDAGQTEVRIYFKSTADNTWQTAYTVPTGKTVFITDAMMVCEDDVATIMQLGVGAAPQIIWHSGTVKFSQGTWGTVGFKFSSGDVIKFFGHSSISGSAVNLTGWIE